MGERENKKQREQDIAERQKDSEEREKLKDPEE